MEYSRIRIYSGIYSSYSAPGNSSQTNAYSRYCNNSYSGSIPNKCVLTLSRRRMTHSRVPDGKVGTFCTFVFVFICLFFFFGFFLVRKGLYLCRHEKRILRKAQKCIYNENVVCITHWLVGAVPQWPFSAGSVVWNPHCKTQGHCRAHQGLAWEAFPTQDYYVYQVPTVEKIISNS